MAGDWIKMRVWLCRDPRVIRMADYLAFQRAFQNWLTDPVQCSCRDTAYEHVTRNVTVALCVTGLLVTWGTAREQGDRIGDDLVLQHCDKNTIDAITDIPCFGEAMEDCGWLIEQDDMSAIFPNFFKDNESPDDRHKRQNALRQAKYREKKQEESNAEVTPISNVTVTHREEKRREVNTSSFLAFWNAYPRKVGKGAAEKAFAKVDAPIDSLLTAVQRQSLSPDWTKEGGRYIPHPATWLNQRRWEDEPAVLVPRKLELAL